MLEQLTFLTNNMPTTITSAGVTFTDTTTLTSANIGTAQLVNGSVTAAKLGTNEQKQIAKAWVNFNGTTSPGTIRSNYNVSSVTKTGTGDYTVNFATPMADANYTFFGCGRNDTDLTAGYPPCISQWLSDTQSTTQLRIRGTNGNNNLEDFPTLCVSIFGN